MRPGIVIVAQRRGNRWSAWVDSLPDRGILGNSAIEAVRSLLQGLSSNEYDKTLLSTRDDASRDGHMEFVLPVRSRPIPTASKN